MLTLMSDRFAPVTSKIGFLHLPLQEAAGHLVAWRERLHPSRVATRLATGTLDEALDGLLPLTTRMRPRELLVATKDPSWTAYFDCMANGGDPSSVVGHLSRATRSDGLVVCTVPHKPGAGPKDPGRLGAVQFELLGPEIGQFSNLVRSISVTNDGDRWQFDANGTVQPYERADAYRARRIKDRFTSAMLAEYCAALGLAPFDETFYAGDAVLVETRLDVPDGALLLSLQEAQGRLGIRPGAADSFDG